MAIKQGDLVEFKEPNADEVGCVYQAIEVNGDRTLIGIVSINGVPWKHTLGATQVVMTDDLKVSE